MPVNGDMLARSAFPQGTHLCEYLRAMDEREAELLNQETGGPNEGLPGGDVTCWTALAAIVGLVTTGLCSGFVADQFRRFGSQIVLGGMAAGAAAGGAVGYRSATSISANPWDRRSQNPSERYTRLCLKVTQIGQRINAMRGGGSSATGQSEVEQLEIARAYFESKKVVYEGSLRDPNRLTVLHRHA
ncbi:MAG: hypothetical protein S4CHLAM2_14910 [Chlamydiales bacterium]|nr:hypothetical protein [Chlamydiales bacterium]